MYQTIVNVLPVPSMERACDKVLSIGRGAPPPVRSRASAIYRRKGPPTPLDTLTVVPLTPSSLILVESPSNPGRLSEIS